MDGGNAIKIFNLDVGVGVLTSRVVNRSVLWDISQ
jgi:hypothetical protein